MTTQCHQWGSNLQPLDLVSSTLPPSALWLVIYLHFSIAPIKMLVVPLILWLPAVFCSPQPSFCSIWHMIHKLLLEEFQDDCNFGYQNRFWISVASMASSNHLFKSTYGLGDAVWIWLPWWPSWISEQNDLSNSKSQCYPDASHSFSSI